MKSYRMDRLITIQQASYSQSTTGEPVESWADLATVWAEVQPMTGREYYKSDQVLAEASTLFVIRYRAGLNASMRIQYNDESYNIRYIREIGRQDGMEITAQLVRRA